MEALRRQIEAFIPACPQEETDKARMLEFLATGETPLSRANETAHFTASAWIVDPTRTRVLMVWHNLYRSWSWTGGHADGETDLLAVALREAWEETGITGLSPAAEGIFSLEILPVAGHEKRGRYISSHLHMNVTYLLEGDDALSLTVKPDENSAVAWLTPGELEEKVSEPWMLERIYRKLTARVAGK